MYDRDRERDRDRGDAYRPRRSPPRQPYSDTRGPPAADTYTPTSLRGGVRDVRGRDDRNTREIRRSRSPPPAFRRRSPPRENNWRAGDRRMSPPRDRRPSPPRDNRRRSPAAQSRGGFSPRRDDRRGRFRDDDRAGGRYRSPVRDVRDSRDSRDTRDRFAARSPLRRERSRSPAYPKRRNYSPADRERLRSPPAKRERLSSPPRRYDSPPRRPRSPPSGPRADVVPSRRDRSPSPRREDGRAFSRTRDFAEATAPVSASTSRRSSPPPIHPDRMAIIEPEDRHVKQTTRSTYDSPATSPALKLESSRDSNYSRDRDNNHASDREAVPHHPSETSRAPPSGPASSRPANGRFSPPSGPAASSSAAPARVSNPILSAPSRPRGGRSGGFGGSYRGDFGAPSPRRGEFASRGGYGGPPRGSGYAGSFRGNSSSGTYPHTQRFNTGAPSAVSKYLGDLPQILPGGQRAPPRDAALEARLRKLDEEAEKLRSIITEKSKITRNGLKEWDQLKAETESARIRGDFAEENLRKMTGEPVVDSF